MSKSSVSIPYLVAWVLGIITLVVAVYFIYSYIMKSPLNCAQCRAEVTGWCARCYRACGAAKKNWNGAPNSMNEKLKECINRCNLGSEYNLCDSAAFEFCAAYIGF